MNSSKGVVVMKEEEFPRNDSSLPSLMSETTLDERPKIKSKAKQKTPRLTAAGNKNPAAKKSSKKKNDAAKVTLNAATVTKITTCTEESSDIEKMKTPSTAAVGNPQRTGTKKKAPSKSKETVNKSSTEHGQPQLKQSNVSEKDKSKTANKSSVLKDDEIEQQSSAGPVSLTSPVTSGTKSQTPSKSSSQKDMKKKEDIPLPIPPNQPQLTNDINYGSGKPIVVLHIGEKPSIAQAVAKGLCSSSTNNLTSSRGKSLPVYEFSVTSPPFPKAPNASKVIHKVTSVAGHVFSVDFVPQFQSWEIDPVHLFSAPIVRKPCQGSVVKHLQYEAEGVDFLVLWMDCDREGENINFEALDCCLSSMKGASTAYDRVYRAYFSAINPSDIQKAYQRLGKPDKNQSLSVDARQELDLKVGVAFSRFQTKFFQGRYGDLDSGVLSYGPCQTPTLGFCVQRYLDIETFSPEPYWLLDLSIMKRGRVCKATWDSGRSFNRKKVEQLLEKCWEKSTPPSVRILSVVSKHRKQGRPTPLNTVALLKACSKALGIGPQHALHAAERLYLSGYLSYPRTESTAYPKSFDINGALQAQATDSRWGSYVRELLQDGPIQSKRGVDMGDHPPITPCRGAHPGELSGDMARVYDLVVRHFIATVSRDADWCSTKVELEVKALEEHGKFTIRGKQLVSPGFLAILLHKDYENEQSDPNEIDDNEEEEKVLPEFVEGEEVTLSSPNSGSGKVSTVTSTCATDGRATLAIKEKMTTPPSLLSESELITLMEKNGIGTDASISTHIENILKRNYVSLVSGRRLEPTKLGLVLAQGYHLIDSSLVLPQVRASIEGECNKIAKGLASKETVVQKALNFFQGKFTFFVENIAKMDMLFGSSFARLEDVGKPFSRCGLTRRYLQLILGPPPRLYNKFTETVYALPCGGTAKQWTGKKCPVPDCDFELCLYTVGSPSRTYPLCPNCFNTSKEDLNNDEADNRVDDNDAIHELKLQRLAGRTLTLACPLPDRHPAIAEMAVMQDKESGGLFILDPTSLGSKWRLVSTRSPSVMHLPQGTEKVTLLDRIDDETGCHYIQIDFKEDKIPLQDGCAKRICYLPKDEPMLAAIRTFRGSETPKASNRRGTGGRGGGRRGGRGFRRG